MKNRWFKLGMVTLVVAILTMLGVGAVVTQTFAQGPQPGQGRPPIPFGGGPRGGPFGQPGQPGQSPLAVIAKALGMSEADLMTALQGGKSVADVAKEKNVALDKVVDAIIADRVADMKANLPNQLSQPFRPGGPGGPGGPGPRGMIGGPGAHIATAAKELGMSEADLLAALRSGKTVADVAKEKNVALDKIVNAIVAQAAENFKKAVSDGRMTQEQADKMLAEMKTNLPKVLSEKFPQGGFGPGGPGGPQGGRPPFGPGGPQGGQPPFGPGGPRPNATPGTR